MNTSFRTSTVVVVILVLGTASAFDLCQQGASDLKWSRDPENCAIAYFCLLGRPVAYTCPEGHVIGANKRFCVPVGSELDDCTGLRLRKTFRVVPMTSFCKPGEVSPDERSCAKYFECVVQPSGNTTMQGAECDYPELFSADTGKCEHFKDVKCSPGQMVPKSQCDYDANQCTMAHCIPCNIRYPSCVGLPDGMHSWAGKEWSPYYVVCEEERVTFQGQCKSEKETKIFHPEQRQCIVVDDEKMFG